MTPTDQPGDPDTASPAPTDTGGYGFPAALWRGLDHHRPPGANRLHRWRSPLRGLWLTSVFGAVLLVTLPIVIITGLLSYMAYGPQFGQAIPADVGGSDCRRSTGPPTRPGSIGSLRDCTSALG